MNRGIGACFLEVEVDTWTGDWEFIKAVYAHDSGKIVNPMVGEGDMTDRWCRVSRWEPTLFRTTGISGTRHYAVGFLSYRLPTIMDVPDATQIFVSRSRDGSSAVKDSRKRQSELLRAAWRTRSTTLAAFVFVSIRSRKRKSWRA